MLKATKLLIIPVLMVMLAVLAAGCGGNDVENMTADDVRQVLADSVEATTEADSFTFTMNAGISANMTGEAGGSMSADMSGSGAADLANESMKFTMDASASVDMGFFNMSFDDIGVEMYKVGDWVYQHVTWPEQDSGWTKTPAGCDDGDSFDRENMREQLSFVEFPAEVEMLREEKVNGEDCYVIRLVPDAQKLADALSGLPESPGPMTNTELQQLEDTLENTQFTVWIAKDSKLFMKFVLDASIDTSEIEGTVGMPTQTDAVPIMMEGDAIMNIDLTVTMADYNKEVEITLPPLRVMTLQLAGELRNPDRGYRAEGGEAPHQHQRFFGSVWSKQPLVNVVGDNRSHCVVIARQHGHGGREHPCDDHAEQAHRQERLADKRVHRVGVFDTRQKHPRSKCGQKKQRHPDKCEKPHGISDFARFSIRFDRVVPLYNRPFGCVHEELHQRERQKPPERICAAGQVPVALRRVPEDLSLIHI